MLQTESGFKFRFYHHVPLAVENHGYEPVMGGSRFVLRRFEREGTACEVELPDTVAGLSKLTGFAICHPNDPYSRSEGRKRALASAIATLPRSRRGDVWAAYWKMRKGIGKSLGDA